MKVSELLQLLQDMGIINNLSQLTILDNCHVRVKAYDDTYPRPIVDLYYTQNEVVFKYV